MRKWASITIFRNEGCKNNDDQKTFERWVDDLKDEANGYLGNWRDETSSVRVNGGVWELYEHDNYRGVKTTLGKGTYLNMRGMEVGDGRLSSLKFIAEEEFPD